MFLELVKNGSLLSQHFDRFISGSYGVEKPFAILDINFKTDKPRELPEMYKEFEEKYFTYVVQTRQLFRGAKLFRVEPETETPLVT